MIQKLLLLSALLISAYNLVAQNAELTLKDLKTPTSPGFILMDETPTSIDKPSTPAGLGLSLLNLSKGGALETAPYWLIKHPDLDFEKYVYGKHPLLQTLSLSVSSQSKGDSTLLGFGFRINPLRLRSKGNLKHIESLRTEIENILNDLTSDGLAKLPKLKKEIMEMIDKPTLMVSVAGSTVGVSPESNYENLKQSRMGIWANFSYVNKKLPDVNFILLTRYLKNPAFEGYAENAEFFDLGGSVMYQQKYFGASAEYVQRAPISGTKSFNRIAGILEVKLIDNFYLTGTIGKNFDEAKDLFVLFGINVGVSQESKIKK